jgi:hypothetical protein
MDMMDIMATARKHGGAEIEIAAIINLAQGEAGPNVLLEYDEGKARFNRIIMESTKEEIAEAQLRAVGFADTRRAKRAQDVV